MPLSTYDFCKIYWFLSALTEGSILKKATVVFERHVEYGCTEELLWPYGRCNIVVCHLFNKLYVCTHLYPQAVRALKERNEVHLH